MMSGVELVHQIRGQLWEITFNRYLTQELFSWQWWGLIALLAVFYTVWWRLVDKRRLVEILLFGSFMAVTAAVVDIAGVTAARWQYNVRLFPILPAPFPFDYTVIPIMLMLAHQYGTTWGRYLGLAAVAGAIFYFVIIPAFVAAGMMTFFDFIPYVLFVPFMVAAAVARVTIIAVVRKARDSAALTEAPRVQVSQVALQPLAKPEAAGEEVVEKRKDRPE